MNFPGIAAFLPADDHEAVNTGLRNPLLSKLGTILGQASEHGPEAQAGIIEEAKRVRALLAAHLEAADRAIEMFEPKPAPKQGKAKDSK